MDYRRLMIRSATTLSANSIEFQDKREGHNFAGRWRLGWAVSHLCAG